MMLDIYARSIRLASRTEDPYLGHRPSERPRKNADEERSAARLASKAPTPAARFSGRVPRIERRR